MLVTERLPSEFTKNTHLHSHAGELSDAGEHQQQHQYKDRPMRPSVRDMEKILDAMPDVSPGGTVRSQPMGSPSIDDSELMNNYDNSPMPRASRASRWAQAEQGLDTNVLVARPAPGLKPYNESEQCCSACLVS